MIPTKRGTLISGRNLDEQTTHRGENLSTLELIVLCAHHCVRVVDTCNVVHVEHSTGSKHRAVAIVLLSGRDASTDSDMFSDGRKLAPHVVVADERTPCIRDHCDFRAVAYCAGTGAQTMAPEGPVEVQIDKASATNHACLVVFTQDRQLAVEQSNGAGGTRKTLGTVAHGGWKRRWKIHVRSCCDDTKRLIDQLQTPHGY